MQGIENKRTRELSEDELTQLRDEVEKYTIEGDLRRFNALNIKRLKEIQCYRGKRHIAVRLSAQHLREARVVLMPASHLLLQPLISCMAELLSWFSWGLCWATCGSFCSGQVEARTKSSLTISAHVGCRRPRVSLCLLMQQLPVRGQTTKNNARTRKGKAVAIAGKKK